MCPLPCHCVHLYNGGKPSLIYCEKIAAGRQKTTNLCWQHLQIQHRLTWGKAHLSTEVSRRREQCNLKLAAQAPSDLLPSVGSGILSHNHSGPVVSVLHCSLWLSINPPSFPPLQELILHIPPTLQTLFLIGLFGLRLPLAALLTSDQSVKHIPVILHPCLGSSFNAVLQS